MDLTQLAKLVLVLAIIVALGGLWKWHTSSLINEGKAECTAEYTQRDNKALKDAQAAVEVFRAREAKGATEQAATVAKLQKDKDDALAKKDAVIVKLRAGTLVLRDPGARGTSVCSAGATTGSSSSGDIETSGGKLSTELSEFLIGEATRADQVVTQLQACQAQLVNDRKIVNGN